MDSKIQHKYIDDQIEVIRLASTPDNMNLLSQLLSSYGIVVVR